MNTLVPAIGIDLGGSRIKAVLLQPDNQVVHSSYAPTIDDAASSWKQAVAESVARIAAEFQLSDYVTGIAAPGIANAEMTAIQCMPGRLQGLENFDWTQFLQRKTRVLNDAVAALMGESRLGIAINYKQAVMLTLGTGVGGALLINGQPYLGAFQKAGHAGHMVIDSVAAADVTGMPGSLEQAIGNASILQRSDGRFSDSLQLIQAFKNGDHHAQWVWLDSVRKLALAMASISNLLSPECFIIGGGITEAGKDLFEPLKQFFQLYDWSLQGKQPPILKAALGDMAGAIGAACLARENNN